jgi:hypothetical protein
MRSKLEPFLIVIIIISLISFVSVNSVLVHSAGSWTVSGESDDTKCSDGIDNDGDGYVDWDDLSCRSLVQGYVKDNYGNPIYNASVYVIGPDNELDYSDSLGYYELYAVPKSNPLGNGNDNLFFALNKTHRSETVNEEDIKSGGITYLENHTLNLTLFENDNVCESDCTYKTDTMCHVDCLGINGCYNSEVFDTLGMCGSVLNPYEKGTILTINSTDKVVCCNGDPYKYQPEDVDETDLVELNPKLDNVKSLERIVFIKGQSYKVHVVLFDE